MARRQEFLVDMHVHSLYSGESPAEPRDIVEAAIEKGLDAIVITEHERLSLSLPFEELQRSTNHLVIIRGVELSTDAGHMLVYGVKDEDWKDWGANRESHAQELISRAAKLGGIAVPAHPYRLQRRGLFDAEPSVSVDERLKDLVGLKAIEVCNGKQLRYPSVCEILGSYAHKAGLPGTGGSDAHMPDEVGRSYTVFRSPVRSEKDLVREILRGNIHPQVASCKIASACISVFAKCEISM